MPYARPQPIDLAFPAAGVDQSLPTRQQPPLTTWDMRNCRAFPPSSDRLGGGSREGHSKLFSDQAGISGTRRIQGLDVLTEATNITDPDSFASVPLAEDWSGASTGDPTDLGSDWDPVSITGSSTGYSPNSGYSVAGSILLMDSTPSQLRTVASAYFVDQATGVQAVIRGSRSSSTSNSGYNTGGFTNAGVFVAGANILGSMVGATIVATGTNTVECQIIEYTGRTETVLAQSGTLTLVGDSTSTDYTIKITRVASGITATFTATNALTGPANLNVTLTTTTALTGLRGGLFMRPVGSSTTNFRSFVTVNLTKLVPPSNTVFDLVNKDTANPFDGNRYYLPASWFGIDRTTGGALNITAAGPTSSGNPAWAAIDDTSNTITVTNPGSSSSNFAVSRGWAAYSGDATLRNGLLLNIDPSQYGDQSDIASPVLRIGDDYRSGLMLIFKSTYTSNTGIVDISFEAGVDPFTALALVDNVFTRLDNTSGFISRQIQWHKDSGLRITDDGSTIRFYVNGILKFSFDPSGMTNWTPAITTALANNTRVGFTGGLGSGSGNVTATFGSVYVVQGETDGQPTFSNIKNKLAIYSAESIQIGDTATLEIANVTGPLVSNPLPSSGSFNRKFYAVDGSSEIIVDPATMTGQDWASFVTDGTLPSGTRLLAFFRGAAYLAATDSDPTIWYKARTLDPLDWDYGADPLTSSAVAGNNGEVGQPADAITALVPYSDDYLVFGMARSIGVLEGDPNYGGQFQIVSRETGIVGSRSFCFDDRGNLYFLGAGGLYRMYRGQFEPEPVGPRKLRRLLEELDLSIHLIQMRYRASDRTVRIYITPNDAETPATVVVYDTRTDGFLIDTLPLEFGPWAIEQTNGVLDIDRNIIIGGNDGYIRRPDDTAANDDGTAISAWVEIPIPEIELGRVEAMCQELQFVLGEGAATVTWRWFTGDSPEQVRLQTVGQEVASGTISGQGFRPPVGLRATGAAHKLRLESSSAEASWSLERVTADMTITTTRRR